jgi:hypothetical protein
MPSLPKKEIKEKVHALYIENEGTPLALGGMHA